MQFNALSFTPEVDLQLCVKVRDYSVSDVQLLKNVITPQGCSEHRDDSARAVIGHVVSYNFLMLVKIADSELSRLLLVTTKKCNVDVSTMNKSVSP